MDFEEYLWAYKKALLVDIIRDCYNTNQSLDNVSHLEALHYYLRYLIVGGMPEAVKTDVDGGDYKAIQRTILNGYKLDIVRYIKSKADKEKTRLTYEAIPRQLGQENKRFFYAAIKPEARGKSYRGSVQWLSDARLAIPCLRSKAGNEPPVATEEPSFFKLYFNDVGLLSYSLGVTEANYEIFEHKFHGALTENYVAQALYTQSQDFADRLHYWVAGEDSKSAEIDFLIATDQGSVPIEVKSALNTASKSLNSYIGTYQPQLAYRLSQKNLGFNPERKIKSVPLYAVFCLSRKA
jgi:predicted AAA+ superfamily ATPase